MATVKELMDKLAERFPCFGARSKRGATFNPIADALQDYNLMFAAGVPVKDVVEFILAEMQKEAR